MHRARPGERSRDRLADIPAMLPSWCHAPAPNATAGSGREQALPAAPMGRGPAGIGGNANDGETPKQAETGLEQIGFNFFILPQSVTNQTKAHFLGDPTHLLRRPGRAGGPAPAPQGQAIPPAAASPFGPLIVLCFIAFCVLLRRDRARAGRPRLRVVLLHPSAAGKSGGIVLPLPLPAAPVRTGCSVCVRECAPPSPCFFFIFLSC